MVWIADGPVRPVGPVADDGLVPPMPRWQHEPPARPVVAVAEEASAPPPLPWRRPVAEVTFVVDADVPYFRFDLHPDAELGTPTEAWFDVVNLVNPGAQHLIVRPFGDSVSVYESGQYRRTPTVVAPPMNGNYDVRLSALAAGLAPGDGWDDAILRTFYLTGDANRDRRVDEKDYAILAANYGKPGRFPDGDFNADGEVDRADYDALAANFGLHLPPAPTPGATLSAVAEGPETIRLIATHDPTHPRPAEYVLHFGGRGDREAYGRSVVVPGHFESHVFNHLRPGRAYTFIVRPFNRGNWPTSHGHAGHEATVTTPPAPPARP